MCRGRQGPGKGADQVQPPASDALARGGHQLRRLPGVPLLRPRRAEAGHQRRRGGRLRRGALPGGLREPRRHPRRRGQQDHCPAARARRDAARHHRHLPQRNHPRPPLPLPHIQDRVLAMGESQPPVRRAQVHQRRPRHLHQRMRRQPNIARHHGALRLHLDRRHDVQLHQGGGVRPGHHLRPPPHGYEGDHPRQWRRVRHPGAHRHLLPPSHHLQLRAGAPAVRFGTV